jgi:hypothetical protein
MPKQLSFRLVLALVALALVGAVFAGCGSDKSPSTETGAGAPAGATGSAAGGAAVEAGKQVSPEEKAQQAKNFSKEPPPVQIQAGVTSGYKTDKPKAVVLNSNQAVRAIRKKIYSDGSQRQDWAGTDFATRQLMILVMPHLKNGSESAITDVYTDGKVIKVKVVEFTPGDGCKSHYKTNPWQVVETRKMPGTPTVVVTKQKASPC